MGGLGTRLSLHNIFCPRSAQILSKACNAGKEHKPVRYACTTLARVLMAHTEWLPGVWLRHFCTTLALHIEDCEGWWLSSCHSSVAEYRLHKPGLLGWIPGNCHPFSLSSILPQHLKNRFLSGVSKNQSWNFTTKFEWKFSTVEDFSKCSDQ